MSKVASRRGDKNSAPALLSQKLLTVVHVRPQVGQRAEQFRRQLAGTLSRRHPQQHCQQHLHAPRSAHKLLRRGLPRSFAGAAVRRAAEPPKAVSTGNQRTLQTADRTRERVCTFSRAISRNTARSSDAQACLVTPTGKRSARSRRAYARDITPSSTSRIWELNRSNSRRPSQLLFQTALNLAARRHRTRATGRRGCRARACPRGPVRQQAQ